jgi:CTP synthase
MIRAVKYARKSKTPYLGICLGMQVACIEFARNECGLIDADSTEFNPDTPYPVIFKLRDLVGVEDMGGTMRLGSWECVLKRGSRVWEIYNEQDKIAERHRHRYEFNPEYKTILEEKGLVISGLSPDGKFVEIIELPRRIHPFFVACQFHPEYKSKPLDPHPLFSAFVRAALQNRLQSENFKEETTERKIIPAERKIL